MNHRKQNWDDVYSLIVIIFLLIFISDWLLYTGIIRPDLNNAIMGMVGKAFYKMQKVLMLFRGFYVVALLVLMWNMPSIRLSQKMSPKSRLVYRGLYILFTPLVVLGYHTGFVPYDKFIYPLILFVQIMITARVVVQFNSNLENQEILGKVSKRDSEFYFDLNSSQGRLTIHSPQQNTWIDGGPGSGKSQSIIKPIIKQAAERGYAGVIYDFEGDPREPEAPILGRVGYTALLKSENKNNVNFSFINFTDMAKTVRVNPFSEKYIKDRMDFSDMIQNLMSNLSVNKGKADFWEKYGTAYIFGIGWNLFKNHRSEGLATLPHMISIALNDIDTVLRWASEDQETSLIMAPLISAWKHKAQSQLAGAETSAQLPISVLLDPKIFWVLSEDEFDLDITNKENPYLLCIGNSKKQKQALSPVISVLFTIIMKQMNSAGKLPSIFCIDEFPTVKINGIDTFIATARKHKVATILALQDFTQAERDYEKSSANILRTSCGNQFYGMTGNLETGKFVSDMLGEIKVKSFSYTNSQDNISSSESLQKEKVIQAREIMSQDIGHFTGKIAGGQPPFFSTQLEEFKFKDEPIPDFAIKIKTGDHNMDREILDKLVLENYKRILNESTVLLERYRSIPPEIKTNSFN